MHHGTDDVQGLQRDRLPRPVRMRRGVALQRREVRGCLHHPNLRTREAKPRLSPAVSYLKSFRMTRGMMQAAKAGAWPHLAVQLLLGVERLLLVEHLRRSHDGSLLLHGVHARHGPALA